jgi:hypothetical protein
VIVGDAAGGSVASLTSNDDSFFSISSSTTSTRAASFYGSFPGVPRTVAGLRIGYSGKNSLSCSQTIALKRWSTGAWVIFDTRSVGATETAVEVVPAGSLSDYVSGTGTTGELQVRLRCTTSAGTFVSSADLLNISY